MRIVRAAGKRKAEAAWRCSVLVMNGGGAWSRRVLDSTAPTRNRQRDRAPRIAVATVSFRATGFFGGFTGMSASAATGAPDSVARWPSIRQYSSMTNARISRSRSQMSRSATDCTRPAESRGATFRERSGEIL